MLPIESLHASTLELRNELGLRFLYRLRINITYTKSLNTLDDRKDQSYEENEGATKPTGVHLRKQEQRSEKGGRELSGQEPIWLINKMHIVFGHRIDHLFCGRNM